MAERGRAGAGRLFKSTVADLSRPEVDASVALKAAKSSSEFEAAIGFAALAARAEIPPGQTDWASERFAAAPTRSSGSSSGCS